MVSILKHMINQDIQLFLGILVNNSHKISLFVHELYLNLMLKMTYRQQVNEVMLVKQLNQVVSYMLQLKQNFDDLYEDKKRMIDENVQVNYLNYE